MVSGYQFAGLEYGAECHCGNRISSPRAPEEDCSLVCRGERGSPCGGVGRLSIYKVEEQLPGHRKCESTSPQETNRTVGYLFSAQAARRGTSQTSEEITEIFWPKFSPPPKKNKSVECDQ